MSLHYITCAYAHLDLRLLFLTRFSDPDGAPVERADRQAAEGYMGREQLGDGRVVERRLARLCTRHARLPLWADGQTTRHLQRSSQAVSLNYMIQYNRNTAIIDLGPVGRT